MMPERFTPLEPLMVLILAAVAGAVGGNSVVAYHVVRRRDLAVPVALAHVFLGSVGGAVWYLKMHYGLGHPVNQIVLESFIAGVVTSGAVASITVILGMYLRWWLDRKGLQVNITIGPKDNQNRHGRK